MENANIQPKEKKKSKKKWILIAIAVILILAIGSSGPTVENPNDDASVSQTEKENKTNEATKAPETTKTPSNEIKPGSTVSNKKVKITYKSCNNDFVDYSYYADLKDDYKVVQAVFDFENISSSDIILDGFDCYADGAKCENFYYVDDYTNPVLTSISAGRKLTDVTVYFEVPSNSEEIELEYNSNVWNYEKYIFVIE